MLHVFQFSIILQFETTQLTQLQRSRQINQEKITTFYETRNSTILIKIILMLPNSQENNTQQNTKICVQPNIEEGSDFWTLNISQKVIPFRPMWSHLVLLFTAVHILQNVFTLIRDHYCICLYIYSSHVCVDFVKFVG